MKTTEAFRDEVVTLARQVASTGVSEETASNLVIWFTFALLDRDRKAWTDGQRRAILHRCIKEMQLRLEHGSWSEEWLGWEWP